jgi:RNA recognition motif. (a.k.a. RRM, RBD, or RNP domain)
MSDDLDSFFEEVDEAETSAISQVTASNDNVGDSNGAVVPDGDAGKEPPTKKKKLDNWHRPRGAVVVAAASSAVSKPSTIQETSQYWATSTTEPSVSSFAVHGIPPPPPPLPLFLQPVGPAFVPPPPPPDSQTSQQSTKKAHVRTAAGKTWTDAALADWPDDDFRLFVGNLDPTVTDAQLHQHFGQYASLQRVRVIRHHKTQVSQGYGFVSLHNALECAAALREQDQTWLGGRPIRIKRSHWKDREWKERQKKNKKTRR